MDTGQLAAITVDRRVRRAFGFVDLCGFTDFVDEHGDDGAVHELQILRAVVREITPLFGVRVEKWLGDGVMLVGVDPEPLVGAVLAIEQRHARAAQLSLRAGAACGEVILLEGDDYVGRAVNLASRLCDVAPAGQLLAATDGLELPDWALAAEHDPIAVKGMAQPVSVVAVSPDAAALRRRSRNRTAAALLSVVEEVLRPVRAWSPTG